MLGETTLAPVASDAAQLAVRHARHIHKGRRRTLKTHLARLIPTTGGYRTEFCPARWPRSQCKDHVNSVSHSFKRNPLHQVLTAAADPYCIPAVR